MTRWFLSASTWLAKYKSEVVIIFSQPVSAELFDMFLAFAHPRNKTLLMYKNIRGVTKVRKIYTFDKKFIALGNVKCGAFRVCWQWGKIIFLGHLR